MWLFLCICVYIPALLTGQQISSDITGHMAHRVKSDSSAKTRTDVFFTRPSSHVSPNRMSYDHTAVWTHN